ncbi:MAG: hypothetical protein ABJN34_03630 [Litoreibacter sp.]|uniref:hypothetical protein n=1 Tax=Litoreibacter sp. TaxID=1969459 RepID=UPI0032989C59
MARYANSIRQKIAPKFHVSKALSMLAVLVVPVICVPSITRADTIALEFVPPQIDATNICIARPPDAEVVALWGNWDGLHLPEGSQDIVRRDIKRLKQLDAVTWLPKIEQMIARLEEVDPRFAGSNALISRISAMEAAGAFEELRSLQLIPQLATQSDSLSPRFKNLLSWYYRDGVGVERNIEFANNLLIEAAYAGNADALLSLTNMTLEGEAPTGWDVAPDLATTMAFGALIGELDSSICDRASRIAREYSNGEIVEPNIQLAHDWFRFAADLGDSNSAWKVAEYHIQAEGFEKDNDLLLHYLTQAADAQLPYAQIELGRLYESGALVDKDLDTALSLYRAAATAGERPALTRLAIFLERHEDTYPNLQSEKQSVLEQLNTRDDVSGWVLTRLANNIYERDGRWAGRDQAMTYLERAATLGDLDGSIQYATGLIAQNNTPHDFERAVSILTNSVALLGNATPAKLLYGAFMCHSTDSPRIAEAQFWSTLEETMATRNVEIEAGDIWQLSRNDDPLTIARLQSHALYGSPTALANYLKHLEIDTSYGPEVLAFWEGYSNQYAFVLEAIAEIELELAQNPQDRALAIQLLRHQYAQSGGQAALSLASALLDYADETNTNIDEVIELLQEPASRGVGSALRILASLTDTATGGQLTFNQYADAIDANGDFAALLFAVPFVDDQTRAEYLQRAAGIVPCNYKNVMSLSNTFQQLGDTEGALHWANIATHLTGENPWAQTDLARVKLDLLGDEGAPEALALLEQAVLTGDPMAQTTLFELLTDSTSSVYDPTRAATMILDAVDTENTDVLTRLLSRVRSADEFAQAALEDELDFPSILLTGALSGDAFSMRAYAIYRRDNAASPTDMTESTQWFGRAAEGGDVTAMTEYGYALAFGMGTEANLDNAIYWLEQAADAGSEKAASITSLLNLNEDI